MRYHGPPHATTTFTTFCDLAPMIFETSRQARFIVPMALSLGFGILFATVNTLTLVPCLYLIVEESSKIFVKQAAGQLVYHHACNRTTDRKRGRNFRRHSMNLHSCFPA
jgi:hypothetical protein